MNQASNINHIAIGSLRALAWVCLTLSLGIVVGVVGIVVITSTRPAPTFEPMVVLRWDDVR